MTAFSSPPPTPGRTGLLAKILPLIFISGLLVLIGGLGHFISGKKQDILAEKKAAGLAPPPPINCLILPLQAGAIQDRLDLPGQVEAWEDLTLLAKVAGAITQIFVQEGDFVKQGQVLATIEQADYRIALAGAEAAYGLARTEDERNQDLYDKKLLPLAQLQASNTNRETAKAARDKAALQLSRCVITSPMSGVIQHLEAKVGLLVNRGAPIARILKVDKVLAVVGIPESDVDAVRQVKEVEVTIQALKRTIMAKKHFLATAPEPQARLYRLELTLPNPTGTIRPGMFLRANIVKERKQNVIRIPLYAIISRDQQHYVFIAQGNKAVQRQVETGIHEGWQVEVLSGLLPGDNLIIEGQRQLEDGRPIKIIKKISALAPQGSAPESPYLPPNP